MAAAKATTWAAAGVAINTATVTVNDFISRLDPGGVRATLILCTVGGATLAIPLFGYDPLVAVMLGLVLGTALMEQLRGYAG